MKTSILVLFLLWALVINTKAQTALNEQAVFLSRVTFSDPSYITFRGGIGTIENLTYEVNFAPDFLVSFKKYPNLGLELTPQIILRMFEQHSHPVRTPSYMPKGTLYYRLQSKASKGRELIPFLTIGHHSNGQEGEFYNPDGSINKLNGSFSSNYGTIGLAVNNPVHLSLNPVQSFKASFCYYEIYQPVLRSLYGKIRLHADLESSFVFSKNNDESMPMSRHKSQITSKLRLGWIASDLIHASNLDFKRVIFDWTLAYQPPFVNRLSLFTRLYYGQDYYNIHFERTMKLVQFGILINDFKF